MGPRDLANGTFEVARRDTLEKQVVPAEGIEEYIGNLLGEMQDTIYQRAKDFRDAGITEVDTYEEFREVIATTGGFVSAHWDGTDETEERIKEETKATIRCIPLDPKPDPGNCIRTGKPSPYRVLFAKAY